ncbi:MAG: Na/Pi symporter, partial [Salibacteraceae bacterium]|nr:Na/Pi symporter [Salibacteraceae bacterium]
MEESFGVFGILRLIGSLGLFIYGMKMMSEGIQKVAGNKMREILGAMTSNRFTGLLTGFITTALIQSSSATTVMIVSFVNAGLLTLRQAIGVIMGANIGTTMTAFLILVFGFSKFSISDYALPLIAFGFPMLFFKNNQLKSLGETLIGFSVLFMGLDFLKESVPVITPDQLEFLVDLSQYGIGSTLLFVLIGTLLTVIVQSSSAAMALTIIMCERGMPLEMAAAIVL